MSDYLVQHARSNVWCSPNQDHHYVLKPARLTPPAGIYREFQHLWTSIRLPESAGLFHVYFIGQIHPRLLSLIPRQQAWVRADEVCNENFTLIDFYVERGLQHPRFRAWYYVTEERGIYIAIREAGKTGIRYHEEPLCMRIYQNQYFSSERYSGGAQKLYIAGSVIGSEQQLLDLIAEYNTYKVKIGQTLVYVNGYKVNTLNTTIADVGDVVEYVYDSAIYKVIDFKIQTLGTFDSELDLKGKYLLHYQGTFEQTIDYRDDVDVYILNSTTQKSLYYHRNVADSVRMVTHRDYSVPVAYVSTFLQTLGVTNLNNAYVRLHIRKAGFDRPLVHEHHRLRELYKLTDSQVRMAMLGVNSQVQEWRAPKLENSAYAKLMGVQAPDVTKELVTNAYGYHACANLLADSPVATYIYNAQRVAAAPLLFRAGATAFEYDVDGLLLGHYWHPAGELYNCTNATCRYVEFIAGQGDVRVDDSYANTVTLDAPAAYRFYRYSETTGWSDVTGDNDYSISNGVATWTGTGKHITRSDKKFLLYALTLDGTAGVHQFALRNEQLHDGIWTSLPMAVPMGELKIFLNGKGLIEDLDYFVNFPTVTIVNKEHLKESGDQEVIVRFTGFCDETLKSRQYVEHGFIVNGKLSTDHRYSVRESRVLRVQANGLLKREEEFAYAEDGSPYVLDSALNGKPYAIEELVAPMKGYTGRDNYDFWSISNAVDSRVGGYLTGRLAEQAMPAVSPIDAQYELYSPFFSKIIWALKNDEIDNSALQNLTTDVVQEMCEPYKYLYLVDPLHPDRQISKGFVAIHTHYYKTEVTLTVPQYTFLSLAVRVYGQNRINLSTHVRLA